MELLRLRLIQYLKSRKPPIKSPVISPYTLSFYNFYYRKSNRGSGFRGHNNLNLVEVVKIEVDKGRFISYLDRHGFFVLLEVMWLKIFLIKTFQKPY